MATMVDQAPDDGGQFTSLGIEVAPVLVGALPTAVTGPSVLPWRRDGAPSDLSFDNDWRPTLIHGLHPFPAKFPPALARWAIEQFTAPMEWLLDPFVGSGTALVEARLLSRNAMAAEIDPLSRLVARVKATPLDPASVDAAKERIDRQWSEYTRAKSGDLPLTGGDLPDFPNRDYWFHKDVQCGLVALRNAIADIEDDAVREFLLVVYSSVIIAKGPSSVANALDIAHSRSHHVDRPEPPDVWVRFCDRYCRMRRGLSDFYAKANRHVRTIVRGNDARALPYESRTADAVLTSPPYVTAIDYPRGHKFSVWWIGDLIGVSNRIYDTLRREYIGTESVPSRDRVALRSAPTGLPTVDRIAGALDEVDEIRGGRARRYFEDMRRALGEILRTLKPERHAVLVVAESHLGGVVVPTGTCLIEIAESLNVDGARLAHRDTLVRTIRERSRQMPIKRGSNGNGMKTEEILVFQRRPSRKLVPLGAEDHSTFGVNGHFPSQPGIALTRPKPRHDAVTSAGRLELQSTNLSLTGVGSTATSSGRVICGAETIA